MSSSNLNFKVRTTKYLQPSNLHPTYSQRFTYIVVSARIKEFHMLINASQILHIGHRRFSWITRGMENKGKQDGRVADLILRNTDSQEK